MSPRLRVLKWHTLFPKERYLYERQGASPMAFTLEANGDAGTDFGVAGFARIREIQRGELKSGDISYTLSHG